MNIIPKGHETKETIDKMAFLNKLKNLHITEYYKENEKAAHRMEENICKAYI